MQDYLTSAVQRVLESTRAFNQAKEDEQIAQQQLDNNSCNYDYLLGKKNIYYNAEVVKDNTYLNLKAAIERAAAEQ